MNVPFLDLQAANAAHRHQLLEAFTRVLDSGWYVLGQEVERFEAQWATFCGAPHAVGVSNGLEALTLVLRAWGIGPGDEVIVPGTTFIATWLAVTHVGATPVPVDAVLSDCNMDASLIERAITPRTKAIIPVHLYGRPADIAPILGIARRRGLRVLEDAAQAHGARYRGQRIGCHSDAVAWSFYPGKNLGCLGDGGAITTADDGLNQTLRALRNYGSQKKYYNQVLGYNARLDEVQAALLSVKLLALEGENARRHAIATRYLAELAPLASKGLTLPAPPPGQEDAGSADSSAWHLFVVRHAERDCIIRALLDEGIGASVHYPVAPHNQEAYRHLKIRDEQLPVTTQIHAQALSLPLGPTQTEEQTTAVVRALTRIVDRLHTGVLQDA